MMHENTQAIVQVILPLVIRFRVQCAISVHAAFMRLLLHGTHELDSQLDSPGPKPAAEVGTPKVGRTRVGSRDDRRRRRKANGTRSAAESPLPSQTKEAFDMWRQGGGVTREDNAGACGGNQPRRT